MSKTKNGTRWPRNRVQVHFEKPSMTKQSFKDECDINNILKRYQDHGALPDLMKSDPRYGDFSDVKTYQEALETVVIAEEQFAALPSLVRERFGHDPQNFLQFVTDPANASEMVSLGLATLRPQPEVEISKKSDPQGSGGTPDSKGDPTRGL